MTVSCGPTELQPSGHGGNIYEAAEETGIPLSDILDFSASINPLGIPKSVISEIRRSIGQCRHYPDNEARLLAVRLAEKHGISPESIVCGNGSTELIYLVARVLQPGRVLVPSPTFSEYERACSIRRQSTIVHFLLRRENCFDIDSHILMETMRKEACAVLFLCNPNNPTGRIVKRNDVLAIAEAARKSRCYLVVDEAFMDFCPEESVVDAVAKNPCLVVLRSLTKFYALAGMRLGYGVFPTGLAERMRRHKEPWTVNMLAQKAGLVALDDREYEQKTFDTVARERRFLEKGFGKLGITYVPSSVNYYLAQMDSAPEVCCSLSRKGILVRDCSNFAGLDRSYIRIAVKSRSDNKRLLKELAELCTA